jgi:hypothetical protein
MKLVETISPLFQLPNNNENANTIAIPHKKATFDKNNTQRIDEFRVK